MKKYLLLFIALLAGASLVLSGKAVASFNPFQSNPSQSVCDASTSTATVCQEGAKQQNANGSNTFYGSGSVLAKAVSLIALVTGVASVIMIIVGGIQFALSGGDSNSVNHARTTVLYALIGAAIAVVAESIVIFVINRL